MSRLTLLLTAALVCGVVSRGTSQTNSLPPSVRDVDIALKAKEDFWGQIAVHQRGGPSYEFFSQLMPPVRYVDTAVRHYPIVLSAPGAMMKARLVSNGSAINARANGRAWKDYGVPVAFKIGEDGAD